MIVLRARNAHDALPKALALVGDEAQMLRRETRNGTALVAKEPVTTVFEKPLERVVFWPERDANPFFHLAESLWMLAGRNDVATPAWYVAQMKEYSDDGIYLHGAYGYRWRVQFGFDQLEDASELLRKEPHTRRAVVQMWAAGIDMNMAKLGGSDVPCNLIVHFRNSEGGNLDMTVFCRSNDMLWGAYGANAVHFAFLHEWMALSTGRRVGRYWQVSDDWHAYVTPQLERCHEIDGDQPNPYLRSGGRSDMIAAPLWCSKDVFEKECGLWCNRITMPFDGCSTQPPEWCQQPYEPLLWHVAEPMRQAYAMHKTGCTANALARLGDVDVLERADWIVAAKQWLQRRLDKQQEKGDK